jgi:ADP-heptose:LPS heptosyltransferase
LILKKFLVIQTAFIGDVILATSLLEKLHQHFPDSAIHFLVRKGNESLFAGHPFLKRVLVWNKKEKYQDLWRLLQTIRFEQYDYVINLQRFAATGLLTAFSGAKHKIGFSKNPFSFLFDEKHEHEIGNGKHEIERNHQLIVNLTDSTPVKPKLYPSEKDFAFVKPFQQTDYVCMAPASVWFTKQLLKEKWVELINRIPEATKIYLLGSKEDVALAENILKLAGRKSVEILCGKLSLLQSAALMQGALMNYVNDSAPLHLAGAMNAPVTAIFCSTVPDFGFGPLSEKSFIIQTKEKLTCRPCGLHGKTACPEGHFKCALTINIAEIPTP